LESERNTLQSQLREATSKASRAEEDYNRVKADYDREMQKIAEKEKRLKKMMEGL